MTAAAGEGIALDCILGRSDSLRAEVFFRARLPPEVVATAAALTGTLTGPECRRAITLPVTAMLAAIRKGYGATTTDASVARAILTEPSYWTPELPNLYRIDVRLTCGGVELAAWRRPVGLRRLGVRGRSLWLDGRRYVPRGVVSAAEVDDIAAFRSAGLAVVAADPSEAFLDRCDAEGVAVIGLLTDEGGRPLDPTPAATAIVRWAWHPAVLMAVVPRGLAAAAAEEIAAVTRSHRGTLLLAGEADASCPPPAVAAGVDLLVVTLPIGGLPPESWRSQPPAVPLVARRPSAAASATPPEPPSRRECDALQAALAGWGTAGGGPAPDWAGYLVG